MKFMARRSNMWKWFTTWQCVCSENDHSWCLALRAALYVTRQWCGVAILRKKPPKHTQPLEGLSQTGWIWHIASIRHTLKWAGNWLYFVFGKTEGLLRVCTVCMFKFASLDVNPVLTVNTPWSFPYPTFFKNHWHVLTGSSVCNNYSACN